MFIPKLFTIIKVFPKGQLAKEISSGIIVGIIALPLAIAFGIASGVTPEKGLITAVIGGFIVSFLGGSRVQIGGPTGASIVIVSGIVARYGINGLLVATLMAGVILVIMGLSKLGSMIKFIPYPVIVGFTSGIAVVIFSSQINDFFGFKLENLPENFVEKWLVYLQNISAINIETMAVGLFTLFIIIFWPKVTKKIPGSIIAIILATALVQFFHLNVDTIESRFGSIPSSLPVPVLPDMNFATIRTLIMPATTIAILAAIEALLSAVVADGMIGGKHRSNMELVAQGIANIASPLFGGIPVTGAIARTAANIKNGGRTPIAGIVHALTLLLIMLFIGEWAKLIPMSALAAILIVVAFNMSEYRVFIALLKSPKSDIAVLITTFGLTVIFDLTVAIEIGMILSVILFMRRMSEVSNTDVITSELKDSFENDNMPILPNFQTPPGIEVYEINGPFFFGAATKFNMAVKNSENPPEIKILRMRNVPAIDATGLHFLKQLISEGKKSGTKIILSGVQDQPMKAMTQFGIIDHIGKEFLSENIEDAFDLAKKIQKEMHSSR